MSVRTMNKKAERVENKAVSISLTSRTKKKTLELQTDLLSIEILSSPVLNMSKVHYFSV
jgi:hypothetical protein